LLDGTDDGVARSEDLAFPFTLVRVHTGDPAANQLESTVAVFDSGSSFLVLVCLACRCRLFRLVFASVLRHLVFQGLDTNAWVERNAHQLGTFLQGGQLILFRQLIIVVVQILILVLVVVVLAHSFSPGEKWKNLFRKKWPPLQGPPHFLLTDL